jgi:hypothetical protein
MALVTLVLLLVFCAVPLRERMAHPPVWLVRLTDWVAVRIDPMAMWVMIYALASIFLTPFFVTGTLDVLVRLFAGIMLLLLVLPEAVPQLIRQLQSRSGEAVNEAIAESLGDIIEAIARHRATLAYAGLLVAALLFAVLFR